MNECQPHSTSVCVINSPGSRLWTTTKELIFRNVSYMGDGCVCVCVSKKIVIVRSNYDDDDVTMVVNVLNRVILMVVCKDQH